MSEKLIDDVKGTIGFLLNEMRSDLLIVSPNLTPTDLIDRAITNTVGILEEHLQMTSNLVVDDSGCPLEITGLVDEYWDIVSDDGSNEPIVDLRKV